MKVVFRAEAQKGCCSLSLESDEEFTTSATVEEIDKAYLMWLDREVGCSWEVVGKEDYIERDDFACMSDKMKEKEFPNG